MNLRITALLSILPALGLVLAAPERAGSQSDEATPEAPLVSEEQGLAAWNHINEVFSHPRCANCHVGNDNQPMWSGAHYGETRPHGMNINAGESRIGAEYVLCSTCHGLTNSPVLHGPPGADYWLLPHAELAWFGKTSNELCEQVRDLGQNGRRTIAEIATRLEGNALKHWAWDPGPGREPAPYSLTETTQFMLEWSDAGTPCPEN